MTNKKKTSIFSEKFISEIDSNKDLSALEKVFFAQAFGKIDEPDEPDEDQVLNED